MTVSLPMLLCAADSDCEEVFRERILKQIAHDESANRLFIRIRAISERISHRSGISQTQFFPCDLNCFAEYLDHQLDSETRRRFEREILASDALLAELIESRRICAGSFAISRRIDERLRRKLYDLCNMESIGSIKSIKTKHFEPKITFSNEEMFHRDASGEMTVKLHGMKERNRTFASQGETRTVNSVSSRDRASVGECLSRAKNAQIRTIRILALCGLLCATLFLGVRHRETLRDTLRDFPGFAASSDTSESDSDFEVVPKFQPSGETVLDFVQWDE